MEILMDVVYIAVVVLLVVVGAMLRQWQNEMKELKQTVKNGLATKVDGTEYVMKTKWQEAEYGDLKLTIKELRAANDASHQAIMIEIKRTQEAITRSK